MYEIVTTPWHMFVGRLRLIGPNGTTLRYYSSLIITITLFPIRVVKAPPCFPVLRFYTSSVVFKQVNMEFEISNFTYSDTHTVQNKASNALGQLDM
jgi:hypothetical protein